MTKPSSYVIFRRCEIDFHSGHQIQGGGLQVASFHILVADDFERWRRFVCLTLKRRPELQVICEVSDGLEAVQRAVELQPDLIVLDIGLPTMNGLEAVRRIREVAPESKILILSQEYSAHILQNALSLRSLTYAANVL